MDSAGQTSRTQDSTSTTSGDSWQRVGPNRDRVKVSDTRRQKRAAAARAASRLPTLDISDQQETPAFQEKFPQRPGKGKKSAVPWRSEQDQIAELGLRRLDPRRGYSGDQACEIAPKNPLVAQLVAPTQKRKKNPLLHSAVDSARQV